MTVSKPIIHVSPQTNHRGTFHDEFFRAAALGDPEHVVDLPARVDGRFSSSEGSARIDPKTWTIRIETQYRSFPWLRVKKMVIELGVRCLDPKQFPETAFTQKRVQLFKLLRSGEWVLSRERIEHDLGVVTSLK